MNMNVNDFKQINPFARIVSRQTNTRHLSWMTQFRNRVQSEITEVVGQDVPTMLASAIAQLNAAVEHEDETYMLPSFKAQSEQLMQLDKERDRKYKAAKLMVNVFAVSEQRQGVSPYDEFIDHVNQDQEYYVEQVFTMEKKPGV